MTNYSHGQEAEEAAAKFLTKNGYEILEQNWRTRYCEIDIIAKNINTIYFVEVKYRRTNAQGSGLDYITTTKLRQMKFAAEFWVSENNWTKDYALGAIEVSGTDFIVSDFLPVLE